MRVPSFRRVQRLVSLLALVGVAAFAGCRSVHEERGDDLARASDWESALAEYRVAFLEDPENERVQARLHRAEMEVAAIRRAQAAEALATYRLEAAVRLLEEAHRLDPSRESAEAVKRERARLERLKATVVKARRLLEDGDPLAAEAEIAGLGGDRQASKEAMAVHDEARRASAAFLRDRAAKRVSEGATADARADLERARELEAAVAAEALRAKPEARPAARPPVVAGGPEAGPTPGGAQPEPGAAPEPGAGAGAGPEGAGGPDEPIVGAHAIDAWAKAAEDVKRLTHDYPRPGSKGEAKDYAIPEDQIPALKAAVDRAIAARPRAERQPQWLAHGRLVLQMSVEVACERHVDAAREALAASRPADAVREAERARSISSDSPAAREALRDARAAAAKALVGAAEQAERRGLFNLARLRARQAQELDPYAAGEPARSVAERASERSSPAAVVIFPFQNLGAREGADTRLEELVLHRLEARAIAPVLSFDLYRRRREAGKLPPVARIVKGDVVQLEVRRGGAAGARGAAGTNGSDPVIETLARDVEDARRRLLDARDKAEREDAKLALEAAERRLARAERDRAESIFAAPKDRKPAGGGAGAGAPGARGAGLVAWAEVRYQLYDPATGRDAVGEPVVRTLEAAPGETAEQLETRLLDEVSAVIAGAVERALDPEAASPLGRGAAGPVGGGAAAVLDSQIAVLERSGPSASSAEARAAAKAVLEATGYSHHERRTLIEKLRIE